MLEIRLFSFGRKSCHILILRAVESTNSQDADKEKRAAQGGLRVFALEKQSRRASVSLGRKAFSHPCWKRGQCDLGDLAVFHPPGDHLLAARAALPRHLGSAGFGGCDS